MARIKKTQKSDPISKYPRGRAGNKFYINLPPKDPLEQNKLGNEMCDWIIENYNCVTLEDFPIGKRYAPSRFYKMAEQNEYFDNCLNFARRLVGSRLVNGWKNDLFEKDFCLRLLPLYNEEYRDYINEKTLHDAKGKGLATFIINSARAEDCPEVPERKKDD
jgi:hypothetical protein